MAKFWKKSSELPALSLDDLSHLANILHPESNLDQKLVNFVAIKMHTTKSKIPTQVYNTLLGFDATKLKQKCVYIVQEDTSSFKYGIFYIRNKTLFYKNVMGTSPSSKLNKSLSSYKIIVNTIYDGPTLSEYLMVLQNIFTIPTISKDEENFKTSAEFSKSEEAKKYKTKLVDVLFENICDQIDKEVLSNGLRPEYDKENWLEAMRSIMAILKHVEFVRLCDRINIKEDDMLRLQATYKSEVRDENANADRVIEENAMKVHDLDYYIEELVIVKSQHSKELIRTLLHDLKAKLNELSNRNLSDVQQWSIENRSLRGNYIQDYEMSQLLSMIAWCIYALKLTKLIELRDVQMIAVLIALFEKQHVFMEIKTGEGKTVVIAVVAAVKVLMGYMVHILTSNDILAKTNRAEMADFFEALDISSCSNSIQQNAKSLKDESIDIYSKNIVYGSIAQFQFDHLRNALIVDNKSRYECCILDEVDLLIDNFKHLAKIAEPFPGMEALALLYEFFLNHCNNTEECSKVLDDICIPGYLVPYCKLMWPKFQHNAKTYAEIYKKDVHYIIRNGIIPVDHVHTGALLNNSVFTEGIQQFLEIKHLKKIKSVESLNSVFISNFGFVRKYKHHVFGVTGTLGFDEEANVFKDMFNESSCAFYQIPPFLKSSFIQKATVLTYGWEWDMIKHAIQLLDDKTISKVVFFTVYALCKRLKRVLAMRKYSGESIAFAVNKLQLKEICKDWKEQNIQLIIPLIERNTEREISHSNDISTYHQSIAYIDQDAVIWKCVESTCCIITSHHSVEVKQAIVFCEFGHLFPPVDKIKYLDAVSAMINDLKEYTVYIFDYNGLCKSKHDGKHILVYEKSKHLIREIENLKQRQTNLKVLLLLQRIFLTEDEDQSENASINWKSNTLTDLKQLASSGIAVKLQYKEFKYRFPIDAFYKTQNYHLNIIRKRVQDIIHLGRSVLVICENLSQLKELQRKFWRETVMIYTGDDSIKASIDIVFKESFIIQTSQVILSTNIGGRGTDFKISPELAENGGLHVVLAFIPFNERVELQGFGRTSRNGKPGTGEIIVDAFQALTAAQYDQNRHEPLSTQTLKSLRNDSYRFSLFIAKKRLNFTSFNDNICDQYISFYKHLKEIAKNRPEMEFVIDDVNERWAFWLNEEHYKMEESNSQYSSDPKRASVHFQKFREIVKDILESNEYFNPLHSVKKAIYYFKQKNYALSLDLIDKTCGQIYLSDATISEYFILIQLANDEDKRWLAEKVFEEILRVNNLRNQKLKNKKHVMKDWTDYIKIYDKVLNDKSDDDTKSKASLVIKHECQANIHTWLDQFKTDLNKYISEGEHNWIFELAKFAINIIMDNSGTIPKIVTKCANKGLSKIIKEKFPNQHVIIQKLSDGITRFLKSKLKTFLNRKLYSKYNNVNENILKLIETHDKPKFNECIKSLLSELINTSIISQKRVSFEQLEMIINDALHKDDRVASKLKQDLKIVTLLPLFSESIKEFYCLDSEDECNKMQKQLLKFCTTVSIFLEDINAGIETKGCKDQGIEHLPAIMSYLMNNLVEYFIDAQWVNVTPRNVDHAEEHAKEEEKVRMESN